MRLLLVLVLFAVEIAAMGGIAQLTLPFLVRVGGFVGAKVAGDFQRKDNDFRQILGTILSFLGQSYVALLYISWITYYARGAAWELGNSGHLLWLLALWAVWAPAKSILQANKESARNGQEHWENGASYLAGLFLPVVFVVGFLIFALHTGANRWFAPWLFP